MTPTTRRYLFTLYAELPLRPDGDDSAEALARLVDVLSQRGTGRAEPLDVDVATGKANRVGIDEPPLDVVGFSHVEPNDYVVLRLPGHHRWGDRLGHRPYERGSYLFGSLFEVDEVEP